MPGLLSKKQGREEQKIFGHINASAPSLKEFKEWLEPQAAKGGMSTTCRDHAATAKELLGKCDELGVDDQNVTQEAKDDIRKVIRRHERSAKRKAVPPWSVPTEGLILSPSPGYYSVRDQERRGVGCLGINPAKFRLCWQLL